MNAETRRRLRAINQRFYQERADAFSATRGEAWAGWPRVLETFRRRRSTAPSAGPLRVLDVGCGNGRFAVFLAESWPGRVRYLGLDASERMLDLARQRLASPARTPRCAEATPSGPGDRFETRWQCLDVLDEDPLSRLPKGPFDLVVAFGLLHHVPEFARRQTLVRELHGRVAREGLLALTFWRFGDRARFAQRALPWATWNERSASPIDLDQLEPGDWLLRFGEDGETPRYCHHCGDAEIAQLQSTLDADSESFDADGRDGDLNRYWLVWGEGA